MKFALIFLMAFVALSQQFYLQRPNVPMVWLSPHPARHFFNNYRPIVVFNEDLNRDSEDNQNNTDDGEQDEYPDVQSRIKSNRPSLFDNQQPQSGRFLAGSFGNTNGFNYNAFQNNNNPFLRTYTTTTTSTTTTISLSTSTSTSITTSLTTSTSTIVITNTATLPLTSVVRCIPQFQILAAAPPCGRKKRGIDDGEDSEEHHHFMISPSETFKLMPTAVPSETRELALPAQQLTSSKDEVIHNVEVSTLDQKREKRFLLNNRNYYTTSTVTARETSVITIPTTTVSQSISTLTSFTSTTFTTFVFASTTVTNTVNFINPVPPAQCAGVAANPCVSCLPTGFVRCPN